MVPHRAPPARPSLSAHTGSPRLGLRGQSGRGGPGIRQADLAGGDGDTARYTAAFTAPGLNLAAATFTRSQQVSSCDRRWQPTRIGCAPVIKTNNKNKNRSKEGMFAKCDRSLFTGTSEIKIQKCTEGLGEERVTKL